MRQLISATLAINLVAAMANAAATTAPARWGVAQNGLAVSISLENEPTVGGKLIMRMALRNGGVVPVRTDGAFGWLLLAQSRDVAVFSEKIELGKQKLWPAELPAGQTAQIDLDLSDCTAYAFVKGLKVVGGYPAPGADGEALRADGTIKRHLPQGSLRARWTLVLPVQKPPVAPASNVLVFTVKPAPPPELANAPKEVRELVEQFHRNEFAAKAAHDRAVKMGAPALPALLAAVRGAGSPDYSRMWMATAIIDIADGSATNTLLELLRGDDAGVRYVIAYHGPKMKNARLDEAITVEAQGGRDPLFTAWAARGFSTFGGSFPQKMIDIALASKEPRARAEVAGVLARKPEGQNLDRLLALLKDEHEMVRSAAARAISGAKIRSAKAIEAMIGALDVEGSAAQQSVCAALSKLTGNEWVGGTEASAQERAAVVKLWKDWWAAAKKDYR